MRYHIRHEADERYGDPVRSAQHLLHLRPRECPWQQVERYGLDVEPTPTRRRESADGFGNPLTRLEIEQPYSELRLASETVCGVAARPWSSRSSDITWESVRDLLAFSKARPPPLPIEAQQYQFESTHIRCEAEFAGYAGASFLPGRPMLDACTDLMHRIHGDFSHKSSAVTPSLLAVLEQRSGGSQDFAHLMIGCLRSFGLAARYVAGYLRTDAPVGERRRAGFDAVHAWLGAYVPDLGWVEFDPTLDSPADERHIVLAWGRDFADVSPLRAVIHGGGEHALRVAVTVTPLDEFSGRAARASS